MPVINPALTTAITPQRPTEQFGEEDFTDLSVVGVVISLSAPSRGVDTRFTQDGTMFAPRGADIQAADRFSYQGHWFRVVGWARGDQNHPISGDDFGWMTFAIEAAS
jgi:hypothetical protein